MVVEQITTATDIEAHPPELTAPPTTDIVHRADPLTLVNKQLALIDEVVASQERMRRVLEAMG
jgi:hypothetical protein